MKKIIIILSIFFIYIVYSILNIPMVFAEPIGFATTQSLYNLEILPGRSYEGEITVFNQSENLALPIGIELSLWNLREDSDDIEFIIAEEALNATKWFEFEDGTNYLLDVKDTPDEDAQVYFKISPPTDTPPGSYFVIMRFNAIIPPHYFTEEGPRIKPEVGVLFFIKIPNPTLEGNLISYRAEIVGLEPKNKEESINFLARILPRAEAGVFESIVKEMTAKIQNTGIYHFETRGFIEFKNIFGRTMARTELPSRIMMPNRTRSFPVSVIEEEGFWKRNTHIGPYTATMVLNVPDSSEVLVRTITFWAFPWKNLILIIFIFAASFLMRKRIVLFTKVLFGKIK